MKTGHKEVVVYAIKSDMINLIINAIKEGLNLEEEYQGSDQEMEFNLLHATKIEILESTNAKYKRQI